MSTQTNYIRVTSLGQSRSGTSQKGNLYIMGEAFAFVSDLNCPYPQKISYFCETPEHVLKSGDWLVPITHDVKDGRLDFRLDTTRAVAYSEKKPSQPTQQTTPQTTASAAKV